MNASLQFKLPVNEKKKMQTIKTKENVHIKSSHLICENHNEIKQSEQKKVPDVCI